MALGITGQSMSWLPAMMKIAQKESGFNPRAINLWDINAKRGIPSKGMFQTIDPTFNSYKMPGMDDIYNPVHNAVAAIRYMIS
ncbi:transglycosylase SLT domain-containing protein, partial [Micrococcus sp. SIMBA_144]